VSQRPFDPTLDPDVWANTERDVHTEHCCVIHGCKYGADREGGEGCPVVSKLKAQSFDCESCLVSHLSLEDQIRRLAWFDDPAKNPASRDELERWLRAMMTRED